LQTSDLHIGKGRSSWGAKAALERAERMLDVLFTIAKERRCDAVVIAGDVFDAKEVTNRERELVTRKFSQYAGRDGIPTFVTPGNHDLISRRASNLDFLAEITERTSEIPNLHVAFARAPSTWEAAPGLLVLGVPAAVSESRKKLEKLTAGLDKTKSYVLVGHGLVRGSVDDSGYAPGGKLTLRAAARAAPQIVWWAFGDVHARQPLPTLPRGARGWYAGSPVQMNFGEKPDRGCLVVTLALEEGRWRFFNKRYVRVDDRGFVPLVTVQTEEELAALPADALIRLGPGLRLPSSRRAQLVTTMRVVEDLSLPTDIPPDLIDNGVLKVFDPLLANKEELERTVLSGLLPSDDIPLHDEARLVVEQAVELFRQRIYLS
jgi:DNA repair exonuclease SbcCD nuclease subunit